MAAKGVELASGYISLTVDMDKVDKGIRDGMKSSTRHAKDAGTRMGTDMADALRGKLSSTSVVQKALADTTKGAGAKSAKGFFDEFQTTSQRAGAVVGLVVGKTIGAGIKGGLRATEITGNMFDRLKTSGVAMAKNVGGMIGRTLTATLKASLAGLGIGGAGAIGSILFSGFNRLKEIDSAKAKLRALGNDSAKVAKIMESATAAVEGNQFALNDAATAAASAVAAGVKPGEELTKYLTDIADAASVAGVGFEDMARIFNKVTTGGKVFTGELNQIADRGIPIFQWLQDEYKVTGEELSKMVKKGEVDAATFQRVMNQHIGGAGAGAANSLEGSISKLKASMAKLGAEFITAVLGGGSGGDPIETVKGAVDRLRGKLDELRNWVKAHQSDIRDFFLQAKDAAGEVVKTLSNISGFLKEHPGLIKTAIGAFAAFKTIQGISAVATSLAAINTALGLMPARVATAAASFAPLAAISKALGPLLAVLGTAGAGNAIANSAQGTDYGIWETIQQGFGAPFRIAGDLFGTPVPGWADPYGSRNGVPNGSLGPAGNAADSILGNMAGAGGPSSGGLTGLPSGVGGGGRGYMNYGKTSAYLDQVLGGGTYGLPAGTDTGGYGSSGAVFPAWVHAIEQAFGIKASTYAGHQESHRNEPGFAPNPNGENRGIDWTGSVDAMQKFADYLSQIPQALEQVIWQNPNTGTRVGVAGGRRVGSDYYASDWGGHQNHVHTRQSRPIPLPFMRYDTGGELPPGMTLVQNDTGEPELVLNPDQQQNLADMGVDPNMLMHGASQGAAPGPVPQLANGEQPPDYGMDFVRSLGFVPAAAGSSGVAGTSSLAGFINMGNSVVSGVIDTGTNLAQTAVSAAISAAAAGGSFGAAAPAAPAASMAASYGIQLAGNQAKRISEYWFGLAGIGADALVEQFSPFGTPRWLGYDYTNFAPQLGIQEAATGTLEKMGTDAINKALPQPSGPPQGAPPTPPPPTDPFGLFGAPPPGQPTPPSGPAATPPNPMDELGLYDNGGVLGPGELAYNASRTPEHIFTKKQWDAVKATSANPAQSAPLVQNLYAQDMQDAIRQLEKTKRRDMMQYAGRS